MGELFKGNPVLFQSMSLSTENVYLSIYLSIYLSFCLHVGGALRTEEL